MPPQRNSIVALLILTSTLSPAAFGQVFTSIYSFPYEPTDYGLNGLNPAAGVTVGPDGNLYGAATYGGPVNEGVVYQLKPPPVAGEPWTQTVLLTFLNYNGGYPDGSLTVAANGTIYGTTAAGGANAGCCLLSYGTVFQLTPPSIPGGTWTEALLYSFSGADGTNPVAGLAMGPTGILYGTTFAGGAAGLGEVFALHPPATQGGSWKLEILHSFLGLPDGANPSASVTIGKNGALYGTTQTGGIFGGGYYSGAGTVYELKPPLTEGAEWTENIIHNFSGTDGSMPYSRLELGPGGELFGTTSGAPGYSITGGTVYKLRPPTTAGAAWPEDVLFTFDANASTTGYNPQSGVVLGPGGVLYGTTVNGGIGDPNNEAGAVFALTPPTAVAPAVVGEPWKETILYTFTYDSIIQGLMPTGELAGSKGTIYGVTFSGGVWNAGSIFQIQR